MHPRRAEGLGGVEVVRVEPVAVGLTGAFGERDGEVVACQAEPVGERDGEHGAGLGIHERWRAEHDEPPAGLGAERVPYPLDDVGVAAEGQVGVGYVGRPCRERVAALVPPADVGEDAGVLRPHLVDEG